MIKKVVLVLIAWVFFVPGVCFAAGLASNWGEVIIDNLEPGKEYRLNSFLNTAFTITNNFDEAVTLEISPLIPVGKELKPGYAPILDVSWVGIAPEIVIPAHEQQIVPVTIILPTGPEMYGKKFQFWIWTRTAGQAVGVGLKSRILFSTVKRDAR